MKQQKIEPKFIYEDGKTLCIIVDPDTEEHIKATAAVHPDDLDYESKLVGCTIAYNRAMAKLLKHKKYRTMAQYKSVKELYDVFSRYQKDIDKNILRVINNKMEALMAEYKMYQDMYVEYKQTNKEYIDTKEELHQKLRAHK